MLEAKCLYNRFDILIFIVHVLNHNEYKDSDNRLRSERIENIFIDINFGGYEMRSIDPAFYHELSYIKSITHLFLYEKMGSMTNSDPGPKDRLGWGDPYRGFVHFKLIRKLMAGKNKKGSFLNITTELPEKARFYGGSFNLDYREVKQLDLCLGKVMGLYDHRYVHPKNEEEFKEKWDMTKWQDHVYHISPDDIKRMFKALGVNVDQQE